MIEPLTDEQFEGLKEYYKHCTEPKPDIFALIATIELQKSDKKLGSALVSKIQELKQVIKNQESNLKNHNQMSNNALSCERDKVVRLEKENAKLIWEINASVESGDYLRKENDKLKTQLEAALKRIEEME